MQLIKNKAIIISDFSLIIGKTIVVSLAREGVF